MSFVSELLSSAGLEAAGCIRWFEPVPCADPGVYLVALTEDPNCAKALERCPLVLERVQELLDARPELTLDGRRPTAAELAERLAAFWLPDEPVVYIGTTTSALRRRVGGYYRTKLGAGRPHAGGYWVQLLDRERLFVHYAPCADPGGAERALLACFGAGVSPDTRASLRDPAHPFPFANLEYPPGTRKEHGIHWRRAMQ